jgi:hypothetical protein
MGFQSIIRLSSFLRFSLGQGRRLSAVDKVLILKKRGLMEEQHPAKNGFHQKFRSFSLGSQNCSILFDVLTVRRFALIIVPSILRTIRSAKKESQSCLHISVLTIPSLHQPFVMPITTACIRIPSIRELNKGTSDMPLNRV